LCPIPDLAAQSCDQADRMCAPAHGHYPVLEEIRGGGSERSLHRRELDVCRKDGLFLMCPRVRLPLHVRCWVRRCGDETAYELRQSLRCPGAVESPLVCRFAAALRHRLAFRDRAGHLAAWQSWCALLDSRAAALLDPDRSLGDYPVAGLAAEIHVPARTVWRDGGPARAPGRWAASASEIPHRDLGWAPASYRRRASGWSLVSGNCRDRRGRLDPARAGESWGGGDHGRFSGSRCGQLLWAAFRRP